VCVCVCVCLVSAATGSGSAVRRHADSAIQLHSVKCEFWRVAVADVYVVGDQFSVQPARESGQHAVWARPLHQRTGTTQQRGPLTAAANCLVFSSDKLRHPLHPFNGLFSRTTSVSQYQKGNTSLDLNEQEMMGFGNAVASAGLYANNLHLAPTDNRANTSSLYFYNQQCRSTEGRNINM